MNKTETVPALKAEPQQKKSRSFGTVAAIAVGILLTGMIIGAYLVKANTTPSLQGNEQCKKAMASQSKQLQAALNAQFGTPTPEGTPSLEDVKAAQQKCDETFQMYVVTPSEAKS